MGVFDGPQDAPLEPRVAALEAALAALAGTVQSGAASDAGAIDGVDDAREAGDAAIIATLAQETQARIAGDGNLATQLGNEIQARLAADDALARVAANVSGANQIGAVAARLDDIADIAPVAADIPIIATDLRLDTTSRIIKLATDLYLGATSKVLAVANDLLSSASKITIIATDLLLGATSKLKIIADDIQLGSALSYILRTPQAAIDAVAARDAAATSAASLGAAAEVFPKLLAKDTATAASFTASTGATVAVSGTNLTLNVASGYAWATVNDTSYDAIDFVDPGAFGRFITIGPWSADTSKMIVLDLGSSLGAVGNITTAGVYGGMASVPIGGNAVTATNDVARIIKRGTIWSFLIQRGGTGAYVDYIPPIDTSTWTATPRFGFALISGIGSAQAVAGKVTLLKTGYDNVVANVATNTSDIAGIKSSTSGLIEVAPLLLSKRALATGDLTLVNATPTIGGANNALTLTVPTGQRGYAAFPTGSFRQFTIKLTTASQYMLLGANADGSFVGFSPTDSTYSRYQFTTAGGLTAALGGALPGNTGKTVAAIGDTIRQTLYDGFIYFEIDRGSTGTYAAWLTPFRAGDAYASVLLGMAAPGGSTVVCSGVTVALPGLADLTAQVADNTTNSARAALGGMRPMRGSDFTVKRGSTVVLADATVLLGRPVSGGDQSVPLVMLNPIEQRMEYTIGAGHLGPVIGYDASTGYATVVGTTSLRSMFDVSPTQFITANQVDAGDGSGPGILYDTLFPGNRWPGDEEAVEIETSDRVRIEVKRAAASFTGAIEPSGQITASIAPTGSQSNEGTLTVIANPSGKVLRVGQRVDVQGVVFGTRLIRDNGNGTWAVYPNNQSVSARVMTIPPILITSAATAGSLDAGCVLTSGAAAGTEITDTLTGNGRVGMFVVSIDQTVTAGTAMTTAAQTEWSNPFWVNRRQAATPGAVALLGWDARLQLGLWLNGQTTAYVASNMRVGLTKAVTFDGQGRPGTAWAQAQQTIWTKSIQPYEELVVGSHSIGATDSLYGNGFVTRLADHLGIPSSRVINSSWSGYSTPQLLARVEAIPFSRRRRLIIYYEGVNSYNSRIFSGGGSPFPQIDLGSPLVDATIFGVASFNGVNMTVASGGPYLVGDFIIGPGVVPYTRVQSVVGGGAYTLDTAQAAMSNVSIYSARDFSSALRTEITKLGEKSPNGTIKVFSEFRFDGYTTGGGRPPDDGTNGATKMIEYIDATLAVSDSLAVESFDAWRKGPFTKWNLDDLTYDKLHKNVRGQDAMFQYIRRKVA